MLTALPGVELESSGPFSEDNNFYTTFFRTDGWICKLINTKILIVEINTLERNKCFNKIYLGKIELLIL